MRCISFISSYKGINLRNLSFLVVFFIGMQIGFAAEDVPQQVQDWQAAAAAYEASGNFSDVHAEYDKIIQAYPNTWYGLDACGKSAQLYIKQKQFESIEPIVEQMCTAFSDQRGIFGACFDLIEKCMYASAYPEAEAICAQVQTHLSANPRSTLVIGWRGMLYAAQSNLEGAEQMRQALLQKEDCIASDFLDGMAHIGWGYYCSGKWDEALTTYRLALERDSTHPNAVHLQYQIVKTCITQADIEAADREIQTLLEKHGHRDNTPGLAMRLANEYYKKRQYEGAIRVYESLLTQFADHELVPAIRGMEIKSYRMLADRYRYENQTAQAVAAYEAILSRFPEDEQIPSIRDEIVKTYADAGDLDNALTALQIDIEQCPHRRELLRMITRVAVETARTGNTDTAMNLVNAIFDQNPKGADQQLFGYTTRARVYVHEGNDAQVSAIMDEAMEIFKASPDELAYHLFGIGEEYFLLGEKALQADDNETADVYFSKAIAFWDKMIKRIQSAHLSQVYFYSAKAYQHIGDYEKAAAFYHAVVNEWPNYRRIKESLIYCGQCYCKLYAQQKSLSDDFQYDFKSVIDKLAAEFPDTNLSEMSQILGAIKYDISQWDDAITYLELYIQQSQQKPLPDTYFMLAQSYANSNRNQDALSSYLKYLNTTDGRNQKRLIDAQEQIQYLSMMLSK